MLLKGSSAITLTSPMFNWTSTFPSLCFTFRYMKFGQGTQTLKVSIKTSEEAIVPVWTDKGNTKSEWKYGQVPIRSTAPFQVRKIDTHFAVLIGLGIYRVNSRNFLIVRFVKLPEVVLLSFYPRVYTKCCNTSKLMFYSFNFAGLASKTCPLT